MPHLQFISSWAILLAMIMEQHLRFPQVLPDQHTQCFFPSGGSRNSSVGAAGDAHLTRGESMISLCAWDG